MDQATNAIIAPWAQLGIVGSVVLALGVALVLLWRRNGELQSAHLADVKACGDRYADLLGRKIESDNALANVMAMLKDRLK